MVNVKETKVECLNYLLVSARHMKRTFVTSFDLKEEKVTFHAILLSFCSFYKHFDKSLEAI